MAKSCGHEKQKDMIMATPKLFATTILAASALAISVPAAAEWKSKEVGYEDIDLATPKGQDRLKTRVKQAVKMVCGSPRAITLKERLDQSRCESDAIARAMPKAEQTIAAYLQNRQLASLDDKVIVGN
jgi:UrcA family protein